MLELSKLLNKTTNSCQQTIHEKPTNPSIHHSFKRKTFSKYVHNPSFSPPYTEETKIFKYENHKQKKLNREIPKKSSFFIKNPIKDKPLLHNHKPQTEIICQQKIKPLNDQKNFLLYSNIRTLNP